MQNKIIFREMLSEIKKLADQKGNRLTREEVRDFFAKAGLNQEQLELIYDYLAGQKIEVEGRSTGRKGKIQGSETEDGAEKMSVGKAAEETAEGDRNLVLISLGCIWQTWIRLMRFRRRRGSCFLTRLQPEAVRQKTGLRSSI